MDNSVLFLNPTMAECAWDNNNNGHIDITEYRVLQEVNELLSLRDSNLATANSVLNVIGASRNPNTELVHEVMKSQYGKDISGGWTDSQSDQPYSCAWNASYPRDFDGNAIRHEYYQSSKCFKTKNWEQYRGEFSYRRYGAELEQNPCGNGRAFKSDNSNVWNKDPLVDPENKTWESFSEQDLQNELGLIWTNVSDISYVGADSTNSSLGYIHENFMQRTTGQPYPSISFHQYDEMEMNGRSFSCTTENVSSKLLNADMASIEALGIEGTKGIAIVSVNELDGFEDEMFLSTSYKTEIYSDEQSLDTVGFPVKHPGKWVPINSAERKVASKEENREENDCRAEGLMVEDSDNGAMVTFTTGQRQLSNAKVVGGGVNNRKRKPAKNLFAERRRRKRLNKRLSMLRSVLPTITKGDKNSILSDTIEYTKQLLDQIRFLQGELEPQNDWPAHLRAYEGCSRPAAMDRNERFADKQILEVQFDAKRTGRWDLNIHMTCQTNPSILLSTIRTLESFGLDIHQAIISCFSYFGMQAQFSEIDKDKNNIRPEDIKLALQQKASCLGYY